MCLITEHVRLKESYQKLELQLDQSIQKQSDLKTKLSESNDEVRKLNGEIFRLLNPPTLQPAGTISIDEMSSILLDKLEEMGDDKAELYLADVNCKVYKKEDVVKFLNLGETDKIVYIPEEQDCDDFAAELYGKGVPLLWTTKHALNFFVDTENTLWFIEPQTDQIARDLEDWQGWDCRFFISR